LYSAIKSEDTEALVASD